MLHPAINGAYTELYAGLSDDLTYEKHNGKYIWPWGRVGPVRKDVEESLESRREGGKAKAVLFWEWCERETGKYA